MDFSVMYQTWIRLVTQPNEATYKEEVEKPHATLSTALIWIIIASVIMGILSALAVLVNGLLFNTPMMTGPMFGGSDLPAQTNEQFAQFMLVSTGMNLVFALLLTPIITPIAFLIGSTIYFVVAKLLGGNGNFEKHTYVLAAFSSPLLVVNGLVGIIPFVGGCIAFAIYFYQIVLTYFAVKTVHELNTGKAVLVALTPLLIFLFCAILWLVAFSAIFFATALGD